METDGKYELRGLELFLDGEQLPVSAEVVRAVLARRTREKQTPLCWDHRGHASVDTETVSRILRLERIMAVSRLAALLKEKAA